MLNYHRVPCRAANSAASLSSVSGWGATYEAESIGSPLKMSAVEVRAGSTSRATRGHPSNEALGAGAPGCENTPETRWYYV